MNDETLFSQLLGRTILEVQNLYRSGWQGRSLEVSGGTSYPFDDQFKVVNRNGKVTDKISGERLFNHATDLFPVNDLERDGSAQYSLMKIAEARRIEQDGTPKCFGLYTAYLNKVEGDQILRRRIPDDLPFGQLDLWSSPDPVLRSIQGVFRWYGRDADKMRSASKLVITPSFDRFMFPEKKGKGTYLLPSTKRVPRVDVLWNETDVCHVILVRPFQFEAYVKRFCPAGFVVVAMPVDEEGVGSARYWATVLARALNRDTFVMLDDSLQEETDEVILAVKNQVRKADKKKSSDEKSETIDKNHDEHERWLLVDGLTFLCSVFEGLPVEIQGGVGVMGLRRYGGMCEEGTIARIHFCQGFQLINVASTFAKGVFFRRGYMYGEDILFGQTCLNNDLMSVQLDFVKFLDLTTVCLMVKTSGAHSPFGSGSKSAESRAAASTPNARAAFNLVSSPTASFPASAQSPSAEFTPTRRPNQQQYAATPNSHTVAPFPQLARANEPVALTANMASSTASAADSSQGHAPDTSTNANQPDGDGNVSANDASVESLADVLGNVRLNG